MIADPTEPDLDAATTWVRADLLKALYGAMLQVLPPARVAAYWESHPLQLEGRTLAGAELLSRLWEEEKRVSPLYFWEIFNSLEDLLIENGIHLDQFLPLFLRGAKRSSPVSLKFFLTCLNPILSLFMGKGEPGRLIVELLTIGFRFTSPGSIFKSVCDRSEKDATRFFLYYLPNASRLKGYRGCELNCGVAQSMIYTPSLLGLPPFSEMTVLCDGRNPFDLLEEGSGRIENGTFCIGSGKYGVTMLLNRFLKDQGIPDSPDLGGETEVVLMEKDYFCPRRKRTIFLQGTVWRTPYYMFRAAYPRSRNSPSDLVKHIFDRVSAGKLDPWLDIEPLHSGLLEKSKREYRIVFHSRDESVSINGDHFIKGVPARILRKILILSRGARRFDFEYRVFKRDPEVCPNPKDSHFEIRLQRLSHQLAAKYPCFAIHRDSPGAFTFTHDVRLDFREEA